MIVEIRETTMHALNTQALITDNAGNPIVIEIGTPATVSIYSDRTGARVIGFRTTRSGKVVVKLQADQPVYDERGYGAIGRGVADPNGNIFEASYRVRARSRGRMCWQTKGNYAVSFGRSEFYRDPHF